MFKTEPLYPAVQGDENDPGFLQSLVAFFTRLWSPSTSSAEQLGWAYGYDESGTLLAELGSGGAQSTGSTKHIWLPTASGPMPIAAIVNGAKFAVHADHLNTPRRLTNQQGEVAWQWGYSAFGEEKPGIAATRFAEADATNTGTTNTAPVVYNLRYPGQVFDQESGLSQNGFRFYDSKTGRYTQSDPIGLDGGWNRLLYAEANPLSFIDPDGLAPKDKLFGLPKEFWNWYHRKYKRPGDPDLCKEDAEWLAKEWQRMGRPGPDSKRDRQRGFGNTSFLGKLAGGIGLVTTSRELNENEEIELLRRQPSRCWCAREPQ